MNQVEFLVWQNIFGEGIFQGLMSKERKRPVGRPRLGKIKLIIYVDPKTKILIDQKAKQSGLRRSAFIISLIPK